MLGQQRGVTEVFAVLRAQHLAMDGDVLLEVMLQLAAVQQKINAAEEFTHKTSSMKTNQALESTA